jgi:FKBP-type peptidyl-prolyl cis-trans isomerase
MRKLIVLAGVVAVATACEKKVDMKSDSGQAGYTIGQQIGKNFKRQGVQVDPNAVAAGIADALKDKNLMKEEDMAAAMKKLQEGAMKKMMEEAEANKKKGDSFLAENKAKPNVKTTASGLQYEVLTEGKGKMPKDKDTVVVHYTGTLTNGEKFDSSVDRGEPAEFPVTAVIKGWTEALQMMKEGAKWKLVIPSDLAYGAQGRPGIPPNSTLVFTVELLKIKGDAPAGKK